MRRFYHARGKFAVIQKKIGIHYKILVLLYLTFFFFSQLSSPTTARFSDSEKINFTMSFTVEGAVENDTNSDVELEDEEAENDTTIDKEQQDFEMRE